MVTSILPVILPLDAKRHDQSAPSDLKPPLRSQVSASEESLCPTHLERNCAQQVTDYRPLQINESSRYRTSLREAHFSVRICTHQTLSAAQTVTGRFFFLDLCNSLFVSGATTPGSPGWLHLVMPCVYSSQTRPKDTPGWYRGRTGGEADGAVVWSHG